ncbi:alpha-(1,3)-fucosyltransferase 10 [Plakobranchus ocellatus]|uniref:Fucosyltransferase n=1 Tax=Plakobranchus ocellatus TaxID=259542 RepID=A0AAV3ZM52_9GAST|nr:alpha-(1,3)-fucosyltransferase 10 [Plakobranchus ocellatus]
MFTFDEEDFSEDMDYDFFVDDTLDEHPHSPLDQEIQEEAARKKAEKQYKSLKNVDPTDPIIMWWTEFTRESGKARLCGDKRCFFTNNRSYKDHKNMKAFLFYGTDFSPKDLPLPREKHHEWALFHEESPKNNYLLCHEAALSLFNLTSTFRRESDFPLTTQHLHSLQWLESDQFTKATSQKNRYQQQDGLAPVVYVQSDCDPPSDRDSYVKMLMKHIKVDSYGSCMNNKQLPHPINSPLEGMAHRDFYELVSRYKFAISMENAVCQDYITEKFWRPLIVGTVPIAFGSPTIRDFFPDNKSVLSILDFPVVEDLVSRIKELNLKDVDYDKLRNWKHTGVTNSELQKILRERTWTPYDEQTWSWGQVNFVEAFECFVCEHIHENLQREARGDPIISRWAKKEHYGCPMPLEFDKSGRYTQESKSYTWSKLWQNQLSIAENLKECVTQRLPYCGDY